MQLPGIREMTESDIPEVTELYTKYMERFDMVPIMNSHEIRHQFLSGGGKAGTGDKWRREGQVVWAYVVEVTAAILFLCSLELTRILPE